MKHPLRWGRLTPLVTVGTLMLSLVAAAATPAAAASASTTRVDASGRGSGSFTFAPRDNASSAPSVAALPDGSDIVTWIYNNAGIPYDANNPDSVGSVMVCRIDRGKNGCAAGSTIDLGDGTEALSEINSGITPTVLAGPDGEVVVLYGDAGTIAFVSHDDADTFGPAVEISNTIVPDNAELTDSGASVLIGGRSYLSPQNPSTFQFVDVPLDGSGLDTPTVLEPAVESSHYTLGFYHSRPVIAATTQPTFYGRSAVTWAYQTGPTINDASSWTVGTLPDEGTPSLATTHTGLVLGALNVTDPKGIGQSYPVAATFNGTSFSKPVTVSASKNIGSQQLAAAAASLAGHNRYTITWTQVGCIGRCRAYAVSSSNGRVWTKPTYIGYGLVYNANLTLSPDGGGLLVGYDGGGYEADRLYVGTTISFKPSRARVVGGVAVQFVGTLRTDLGVPIPKSDVGIKVTPNGGGGGGPTDKSGRFGINAFGTDKVVTMTFAGTALYGPSKGSASYTSR